MNKMVDFACPTGTCLPQVKYEDCVPEIKLEEMFQEFKNIEKIPWGYANDCCFTRAQIMVDSFPVEYQNTVGKIWAWGERGKLISLKGTSIEWRYHVAPLVKVCGKGLMVLDPAIFDKPVPYQDWLNKMDYIALYYQTKGQKPYFWMPSPSHFKDDRLKAPSPSWFNLTPSWQEPETLQNEAIEEDAENQVKRFQQLIEKNPQIDIRQILREGGMRGATLMATQEQMDDVLENHRQEFLRIGNME